MNQRERIDIKPWMQFAIVAAIVIPVTLAAALVGPGLGLLTAGIVAVIIVYVAIRLEPRRGPR